MIDSIATPANQEKYKIIKAIVHVSVGFELILQSIIKNKEKTLQHAKDLRLINGQMQRLKQMSREGLQEHYPGICKMMKHIKTARAVRQANRLLCIKAQFEKEVEPINDSYGESASDLQWDGMLEIINNWRMEHRIRLDRTHILVACAKGPKKDLLELQLFHHLYEGEGLSNGEKSFYIHDFEMLPKQLPAVTPQCLITELKRKLVNAQLALDLLGDAEGMNKDALGKYAQRRRVLAKSCPRHGNSVSRYSLFANRGELKALEEESRLRSIENRNSSNKM